MFINVIIAIEPFKRIFNRSTLPVKDIKPTVKMHVFCSIQLQKMQTNAVDRFLDIT